MINLQSIKQIAQRHRQFDWTGTVVQTADLLQIIALAEVGQQAPKLARCALAALLDHDLELCRNFIRQIRPPGESEGADPRVRPDQKG